MRGTITVTLDDLGHQSSLDVEIHYNAWPGEKMVMYDKNGDGYPGSPPGCELLDVTVLKWFAGDESRDELAVWVWEWLDAIAWAEIEDHWNTIYANCCLTDWADTLNQGRD